MGHERVGALPHTKRWRNIVAQLASFDGSQEEAAQLAQSTLKNVRDRFRNIHRDAGVNSALHFLVNLAKDSATGTKYTQPYIDLDANPSILKLISGLNTYIDDHQDSIEYATMAKKASADAVIIWSKEQSLQPSLLHGEVNTAEIWRKADNGAAFCEVARLFFSKFTERYLAYFLDREASAALNDLGTRDQLDSGLTNHIDHISKYAFETSRITQSFAAGWYNKYGSQERPTPAATRSFLRVAFGKIQEELLRESLPGDTTGVITR